MEPNIFIDSLGDNKPKSFLSRFSFVFLLSAILIFFVFLFLFFVKAPNSFPKNNIFRVEQGISVRSVSLELKNKNFIRSRTAFEVSVLFFGKGSRVVSGDYYFEESLPVYEIARRLSKGDHNLAPISVTIPEGFDMVQISETFSSKLHDFNQLNFLKEAKSLEGTLFPDTYSFLSTDNDKDVINAMHKNFEKKFSPFRKDMNGKTEDQIITMASIIEREAKGRNGDREIISGILWKRLSLGMPLQVDAAPETYKMKGLPNMPICNPGLDSIKAAIFYPKSNYLYYLHDKNGNIHYSKTFTEHNANIKKYLR